MSSNDVLGSVLSELMPTLMVQLGGQYTINSHTRRDPERDMIEIVTEASLHLPPTVEVLALSPLGLVRRTSEEIIRELVEDHLRPLQAKLERAGNDTAATWRMATR